MDGTGGTAKIPEGYVAIPISEDALPAPLRICALVKTQAEPMGGNLVVLRDGFLARVLLGCVMDAGGGVHDWLEIWVQDVSRLAESAPAAGQFLSSAAADERWRADFEAQAVLEPLGVIRTGWETAHPLPTFLDFSTGRPEHPRDKDSAEPWTLCQDDALLARKGLPPYSAGLHRYLYLSAKGDASPFVPVAPGCPASAATLPFEKAFPPDAKRIAFNPGAGLLLVRAHSPVRYEDFVGVLGGGTWRGPLHGRGPLVLGEPAESLKDKDSVSCPEGRLFLGTKGRAGRLVESLHLKLRLLAGAAAAVQSAVRERQRPILSLSPESFQVFLSPPGAGLPLLWTARAVLTDPGQAVALPIERSDALRFVLPMPGTMSVYRPAPAGLAVGGRCVFRWREIKPTPDGRTVLAGTFATQERLEFGANDLVRVGLSLGCGRIDLYARLESQKAKAAGEWGFTTIPQQFTPEEVACLEAGKVLNLEGIGFEMVPLLSSPCDLYSLGVLAARTLLVNDETSLPAAMDKVLSLARRAGQIEEGAGDLSKRVRLVLEEDGEWLAALGPHRLSLGPMEPREAAAEVPPELWADVLAAILRALPRAGPDSTCQDFGGGSPGGLHKVFDPVLADLEMLLLRTRGLIVTDWSAHREIHDVVREILGEAPLRTGGK